MARSTTSGKFGRILESEGFDRWRGQSDTEVVLAAFDRFGFARSLALFQGMFAFALLDRDLRRLYLVRDRMGEKPLYFGWSGGTFVFASELKALAAVPGWSPEIDRDAVAALMRYSYIPGSHSIFAGIRKLLPGHQIVLDLETLAPDRDFEAGGVLERDRDCGRRDPLARYGAGRRYGVAVRHPVVRDRRTRTHRRRALGRFSCPEASILRPSRHWPRRSPQSRSARSPSALKIGRSMSR